MSTDNISGDFAGLRSIWRTVSDTDKVGVTERLQGLLRRLDASDLAPENQALRRDIQGLMAEIRDSLGVSPSSPDSK